MTAADAVSPTPLAAPAASAARISAIGSTFPLPGRRPVANNCVLLGGILPSSAWIYKRRLRVLLIRISQIVCPALPGTGSGEGRCGGTRMSILSYLQTSHTKVSWCRAGASSVVRRVRAGGAGGADGVFVTLWDVCGIR